MQLKFPPFNHLNNKEQIELPYPGIYLYFDFDSNNIDEQATRIFAQEMIKTLNTHFNFNHCKEKLQKLYNERNHENNHMRYFKTLKTTTIGTTHYEPPTEFAYTKHQITKLPEIHYRLINKEIQEIDKPS